MRLVKMQKQRGISLVITFLVMTIILAVVLSISIILYSEIRIVSNIGGSLTALYAAESAGEKTFYFDRKQIPNGAMRGFCSICTTCNGADCQNCTATPLAGNPSGCDANTCSQCDIIYDSTFGDTTATVNATVVPSQINPGMSVFTVDAKGYYRQTSRSVQLKTNN